MNDSNSRETSPEDLHATHEGNWYVLVYGLLVGKGEQALTSGLTIRPLTSPLSVFDLAGAGAVGFREWAVLEPVAPYCFCEIESARDAATLPGYSASGRAWLLSAMLSLCGYTDHLCVAISSYSWSLVADSQERLREKPGAQISEILGPFKGNLLDFHLRMLNYDGAKQGTLDPSDTEWITQQYDVFNGLTATSDRFRLALEAAVDWRFQSESRSGLARLWSGIEALLGVEQELRYRISLMAASVLLPRGRERQARFQTVKKLYDIRSKAVHGDDEVKSDALRSATCDSFELLRDLLKVNANAGRILTPGEYEAAILT